MAISSLMQYSMIIRWSPEDKAYLVQLPEFTNVQRFVTHGATYDEAAERGQEVIEMLIEMDQADGKPLPKPHVIDLDLELGLHPEEKAA
jgi:antitoxin HicB